MLVRSLYLQQFRSYGESYFEFSAHSNLVHGANARGKTTLLEAIYLLIYGRSFRTSQLAEMINHEHSFFRLECYFEKNGIEQTLKLAYDGKERRIIHNNTVHQSPSALIGLLQGVMITPEDIAIVKEGPQVRRSFLDLQIAQIDPLYVHYLTRYLRAMKHRNALFKAKTLVSIDTWEEEMAKAAAYVVISRRKTTLQLDELARKLHYDINGQQECLALKYKTSAPEENQEALKNYYIQQYQKHRQRESLVGMTFTGPHRDDLCIMLNQQDARSFGSEGQQRSCVISLKLAEWQRFLQLEGEMPIMLIDDVGISLDVSRKKGLFHYLDQLGQIFLSSTEKLFEENELRKLICI